MAGSNVYRGPQIFGGRQKPSPAPSISPNLMRFGYVVDLDQTNKPTIYAVSFGRRGEKLRDFSGKRQKKVFRV